MKMTHVLAKTGLALAISAMAAGAYAGVHTVNAPGAITLANEIFGAGSQDTLVAIPVSTYDVSNNALAIGDVATVKYTLNKGAVFGEDLSDIDKWAASNANLTFVFGTKTVTVGGAGAPYVQDGDFTIVVDQGGAIGDNTVTFKITAAIADTLDDVVYGQVRVKNLTAALERGVGTPTVSLGAEFRNVTTNVTDTARAPVVLRSQNGVELDGTLTSYEAGGRRARIDVADTELSFTGNLPANTGANAAQDFDAGDNKPFVDLGTLKVVRTKYNAGADVVKKENGDDFDFQGDDKPIITLTSTASMAAYSSVALNAVADPCGTGTAVATGTLIGNSVTISLANQNTAQLEAGYNVCATAGGATAIPESSFDAALAVTYFNNRYTDSADTLSYGQVLRNGCQVTLFNLPNVNAADKGMIRLTNVSELPGSVRASVWTEDGQKIDDGALLTNTLAAHATTVFHTNANLASGVYLGDVLPEFAALENGRHRLVLQGAFPACEALGMVRSPNGTLTNMTSTTYAGDNGRLGDEQSNTSNTTN